MECSLHWMMELDSILRFKYWYNGALRACGLCIAITLTVIGRTQELQLKQARVGEYVNTHTHRPFHLRLSIQFGASITSPSLTFQFSASSPITSAYCRLTQLCTSNFHPFTYHFQSIECNVFRFHKTNFDDVQCYQSYSSPLHTWNDPHSYLFYPWLCMSSFDKLFYCLQHYRPR